MIAVEKGFIDCSTQRGSLLGRTKVRNGTGGREKSTAGRAGSESIRAREVAPCALESSNKKNEELDNIKKKTQRTKHPLALTREARDHE